MQMDTVHMCVCVLLWWHTNGQAWCGTAYMVADNQTYQLSNNAHQVTDKSVDLRLKILIFAHTERHSQASAKLQSYNTSNFLFISSFKWFNDIQRLHFTMLRLCICCNLASLMRFIFNWFIFFPRSSEIQLVTQNEVEFLPHHSRNRPYDDHFS